MALDDQEVQTVGERELGYFFLKILKRLRGKEDGKEERKETKPHLFQGSLWLVLRKPDGLRH
jgi:hypothetical protein